MTDAQAPAAGAYRAGLICLVIACVIAIIPFPTFFLWTVFEFVAFILAIVCLAQGRVGGGIVLLVGSLFLPGILAVVATFVFIASMAGSQSGSSWSGHSSSNSSTTWSPATKPTPVPFSPSQHAVENEKATNSASNASSPSTPSSPTPPAAPLSATQQIEAWPAIDGVALGRTVAEKVGGNAAATIVVPLIAPRLRLRKTEDGRVTWASPDLTTFLVGTRGGQTWLTVGTEQPSLAPAIGNKSARLVGATATTAVWALEDLDRAYTAWPTSPLLATSKRTNPNEQSTISYPTLPGQVNAGNASALKVLRVDVVPGGQIHLLWTFVAKDLSGTRREWVADAYDAETGAATKQVQLFVGDIAANRDLVEMGTGLAIFYSSKAGYQVVDLASGAAHSLPKMPNKPRFAPNGIAVQSWKGSKTEDVKIVVADETGKILNASGGKRQLIGTYHQTDGTYGEGVFVESVVPAAYDTTAWQDGTYAVQRWSRFWLVVNTATRQVLGAIEGDDFLGVQVTDASIRVAVAAKNPYEARIAELLKQ